MENITAALFDLDGVIVDTESEYTDFWGLQGRLHHPQIKNFAHNIKGYTLVQVYKEFFDGKSDLQEAITRDLDIHERNMRYAYVPGVLDFVKMLRQNGLKTAIVTSSNKKKMASMFAARSELGEFFDDVITSDDVSKSKPDPEGYLLAARRFGIDDDGAVIFEDSLTGLKAARASGMPAIGLSTTLAPEVIAPYCAFSIPNFEGLGIDVLERVKRAKFLREWAKRH